MNLLYEAANYYLGEDTLSESLDKVISPSYEIEKINDKKYKALFFGNKIIEIAFDDDMDTIDISFKNKDSKNFNVTNEFNFKTIPTVFAIIFDAIDTHKIPKPKFFSFDAHLDSTRYKNNKLKDFVELSPAAKARLKTLFNKISHNLDKDEFKFIKDLITKRTINSDKVADFVDTFNGKSLFNSLYSILNPSNFITHSRRGNIYDILMKKNYNDKVEVPGYVILNKYTYKMK